MTPRAGAALAILLLVGLGGWAAWMVGIPPIAIGAGGLVVIGWGAKRLAGRRPPVIASADPPPRTEDAAGA